MTLTFNPSDRRDRDLAMNVLRSLESERERSSTDHPVPSGGENVAVEICRELLDSGEYGETRIDIVRAIALASPKAAPRTIVCSVWQRKYLLTRTQDGS